MFDTDNNDRAEPVEDKSLINMSNKNKEKRMTSGNQLELATKSVPALSKPGQEINLSEFDPRGNWWIKKKILFLVFICKVSFVLKIYS